MKTKNAKEIAKIDRQLDRLEAEFVTIKKRADELTAHPATVPRLLYGEIWRKKISK